MLRDEVEKAQKRNRYTRCGDGRRRGTARSAHRRDGQGIAAAFAAWLSDKTGTPLPGADCLGRTGQPPVGTPYPERGGGSTLASGIRVLDCGLASTPAMFMTTVDLGCDAALQITASHHPWHRNGLKFFLPSGGLEGSDIGEILAYAQDGRRPAGFEEEAPGPVEESPYMTRYAARLRRLIVDGVGDGERPLEGFHIVVDAGQWSGRLLCQRGARASRGGYFRQPVSGSGRPFPNHIPNPENEEAMASVSAAVGAQGRIWV